MSSHIQYHASLISSTVTSQSRPASPLGSATRRSHGYPALEYRFKLINSRSYWAALGVRIKAKLASGRQCDTRLHRGQETHLRPSGNTRLVCAHRWVSRRISCDGRMPERELD
jgi:hypothetical protein